MKDINKQLILLEKKKDGISNDLTKLILKDLIGFIYHDDIRKPEEIINDLENAYKDQLHELRKSQKKNSKQLDIEDEIKKPRQLTTYDRDGY